MKYRQPRERSVVQRVANRGRERQLSRDDAHTAYAMDRLLCRLGKSSQRHEFFLKGGVLVAHFVRASHRFTRDIDLLRRHGPPDPSDIRQRFREIVAVRLDDGVEFDAAGVRVVTAGHDLDGYDGVKVFVRAQLAGHAIDLRVDIGFGDAVEPPRLESSSPRFWPMTSPLNCSPIHPSLCWPKRSRRLFLSSLRSNIA